jgi:plastocyanin
MPKSHNVKIHAEGHANPASQHVSNGDVVEFTSDHGHWSVTFSGASPFKDKTKTFGGAKGFKARGTIEGPKGTYKYTSSCLREGETKPNSVDPDIIIDS